MGIHLLIRRNKMNIIHTEDDPMDSTLILAIAWHLPQKRQVENCTNPTAAIICMTAEESPTGSPINISIGKEHYQKGMTTGKLNG